MVQTQQGLNGAAQQPLLLSVCICSFRRPQLLQVLLEDLRRQDYPPDSFEVLVLDNDPAGSAAAVLKQAATIFGARLQALALPQPNISLARNALIAAARHDWIVMIDDDESAPPDWLKQMVAAQRRWQADVVFAPVLPEYHPQVPGWIRRGGYFERSRLASGTSIDHKNARSGNVLMRRSVLDALRRRDGLASGPFDPAYGRTGGEDSMLFRQLDAYGARMIWCDEAAVSEMVPPERASASWLLQRSFRTGQLFMKTELASTASSRRLRKAVGLAGRALLQALLALLLAILLLPFKPLRSFTWLRIAASQCGKLNHFFSSPPQAYGDDGVAG